VATPVSFEWCEATDPDQLAARLPQGAPAHGAPCAPDPFYPAVIPGATGAALHARLAGLATAGGFLALARHGAGTLAVPARPAPLESQHFDRPVFRIDPPMAWGGAPDAALLSTATGRIVEQLRALGAALILARSPESDPPAGTALAQNGFRPSGVLATYAYRLGLLTRPLPRRRGISVRPCRDSDLPDLLPLAARITASPFRRIPGIRPEQVAAFYQDWLRAAAAGRFADAVPVAVCDGRPVGFLCYRTLEELRMCTGARVGGHGLAAVAPHAPGAIFALVAHAFEFVEDRSYYGGEFDADTELQPYIRMLERIGLQRIRTMRNWYCC